MRAMKISSLLAFLLFAALVAGQVAGAQTDYSGGPATNSDDPTPRIEDAQVLPDGNLPGDTTGPWDPGAGPLRSVSCYDGLLPILDPAVINRRLYHGPALPVNEADPNKMNIVFQLHAEADYWSDPYLFDQEENALVSALEVCQYFGVTMSIFVRPSALFQCGGTTMVQDTNNPYVPDYILDRIRYLRTRPYVEINLHMHDIGLVGFSGPEFRREDRVPGHYFAMRKAQLDSVVTHAGGVYPVNGVDWWGNDMTQEAAGVVYGPGPGFLHSTPLDDVRSIIRGMQAPPPCGANFKFGTGHMGCHDPTDWKCFFLTYWADARDPMDPFNRQWDLPRNPVTLEVEGQVFMPTYEEWRRELGSANFCDLFEMGMEEMLTVGKPDPRAIFAFSPQRHDYEWSGDPRGQTYYLFLMLSYMKNNYGPDAPDPSKRDKINFTSSWGVYNKFLSSY
jgi:hypothetical protein